VPGTNERDLALVVRSPGGTTLVINDVIWNVENRPGLKGKLLKLLGITKDEPQIPKVVRMRTVKDKAALRAQLEAWSQLELERIIVSHGGIVTRDPSGTLHELAEKLAA
jgi:hypothetical protein